MTAQSPHDLSQLIVDRLNAHDVDGLVDLYEPDAVLALPDGSLAVGHQAIRAYYASLPPDLTVRPGKQSPTLVAGDLALTSTVLSPTVATAEVARRQPDGTWRWILDRPNVFEV
ncbi:YybH family protein [Kribbella sp. NPDC059898]|uniref:YybH family protein n=1 Tax=Kribbella sp. NPDC059898 TaxID=3346995 RepID=UPI00364E1178